MRHKVRNLVRDWRVVNKRSAPVLALRSHLEERVTAHLNID